MRFALSTLLVLLGVVCRLVPHPMNFAPVGAIALFAGATFESRRAALLVPLASMLIGDLLSSGVHSLMPAIYLSYALIAVMGMLLRERRQSPMAVGSGSLLSSTLFFVITNFAMWTISIQYPRTLEGLIACYAGGIPFFGRTIASDLFFSAILFGTFVWAERRWPALRATTASR